MFKKALKQVQEGVEKIIYTGPQEKVQAIMDELMKYNEEHGYPFQDYYSYTNDHKKYVIAVDEIPEYNRNKSWINKIIKKHK